VTDPFDDFVNSLQEQVYDETRTAYGEVAFQRWQKPLYVGAMDLPDGYGRLTGSCGDTIEVFLRFDDQGRVKDASFLTDGCGSSMVCGSFAAELSLGKIPDELADITGDTILHILGTFPEEDHHCAHLAAASLQEALSDYMKKQVGRTTSGPGSRGGP